MIDIIVPVLGRPQNAQVVVDSIHAATALPHTILFVCSRYDHGQIEAAKATGSIVLLSDDDRYAPKINLAVDFEHSNTPSEFIFLGSDDLAFHPDWERWAIKRHRETNKPVVGTNDLGNATVMAGRHATHSLVHRSYVEVGTIDEPGKLLHEGYQHNWVDTEFVGTAQKRDAFVFATDSHVEHLHPFWSKGTDDDIYAKGRLTYREDRRLFQKRRRLWR